MAAYMLSCFDPKTGREIWSQYIGVTAGRFASRRAAREEAQRRYQEYRRVRPDRHYRIAYISGSELPTFKQHEMARAGDQARYIEESRLIKEGRLNA